MTKKMIRVGKKINFFWKCGVENSQELGKNKTDVNKTTNN